MPWRYGPPIGPFGSEQAFHPIQRGIRQQGREHPTYNVANILLDFSLTLPREWLQPRYGDGFQGAPLRTSALLASSPTEEPGGSHGTASTSSGHHFGGAGDV